MLKVAEVFAERFEVERLAGAGGMGQVFRAKDRLTGEPVALKIMTDAAMSDRFAREARLLAELRHPGIVRYVAHGQSAEGHAYLAMEWVEGETLGARLRKGRLDDADAIQVVVAVAEALELAHARGIVHRDVKPGNILLADGRVDRVKVLDFGIAHLTEATALVTRTGAVLGTVGYMAPEQAKGVAKVDARADVFALGAVLFHCLMGRPPFAGGPPVAILAKLVLDEAPRLRSSRPELPLALDELVSRMLEKEPERRPARGAEVADALRQIHLEPGRPPVEWESPSEEALTGSEQRLVSVLLASGLGGAEGVSEWGSTAFESVGAPTNTAPPDAPTEVAKGRAPGRVVRELRKIAASFGARLEPLRSGSVAVMLSGQATLGGGSATDLVVRSARCALALKQHLPDVPMALATGRGIVAGAFPVGEVIDQAARLLTRARPDGLGIALDSTTLGLLDARFEIAADAASALLVRERARDDTARRLLGRPTQTVGRERELGFLASVLEEAISEPIARAALVTGPAGIGKSRVRYEVLRRARERESSLEVWLARGDPMSAGSPFGLLGQALRRLAGVQDGEPANVSRDKLSARVARYLPAGDAARVASFLGEICRLPFPGDSDGQLDAARRDAVLMGDQMRRAFEEFVLAETSAHPVLLVLEDLHWGDLPTVSYVDSALRVAKERPFIVFGLARPEVHQQFPSLWEQRDLAEIRLGALTRRAAEKLVREVLGERADEATLARIVERADGNAFYLEELIRSVAEGENEALPETVLAMVQARLEALPDGARRVLRAASVMGGVFWRGAVAALLGEQAHEDEIGDWLGLLAEREMVTPRSDSRFPGTAELVFRHALVREAAYAMLTPEDRERGHRLAGNWLEDSGEPDALALAQHFELGSEPKRALYWCRTAAEEALSGNDFETAQRALGRARAFADEVGSPPREKGELELLDGEVEYWRGHHGQAQLLAHEARAKLEPGSDSWFSATALLSVASHRSGALDEEIAIARELVDQGWCDTPGAGALVGCTRVAIGVVQLGQLALADEIFTRIDAWAPSLRDNDAAYGRWLASLATRALFSGQTFEYLRQSRAASASCARAGDWRGATLHRHNIGHACLELGLYEDAEAELREVVRLAERFGLANVAASAMNNLGAAVGRMGRHREAQKLLGEAIARLEAQGDKRMEGGAHNHLAEVLLDAGDAKAAVEEAERAVAILSAVPPLLIQARGTLAQALMTLGRLEDSLAVAERAHADLRAAGSIGDGEARVQLVYAEIIERAGRRAEAIRVLERASQRLRSRASAIDDERVRRTFLGCIGENARTLELCEKWARERG